MNIKVETLRSLVRSAENSAKLRGHTLVWTDIDIDHGVATAACTVCGRGVFVNTKPNSIDIAGEAVDLNCDKPTKFNKGTVTVAYMLNNIYTEGYQPGHITPNGNLGVCRAYLPKYGFDHKKHVWSITHINSGYAVFYSNSKKGAMFLAAKIQHIDFDKVRRDRGSLQDPNIKTLIMDILVKGRALGYKYGCTEDWIH
jgi:hypothetical protein